MISPSDLAAHANDLVFGVPGKLGVTPTETELRRAVSASYYAWFHRLAVAASRVFSASGPVVQRQVVRAFNHTAMRQVCIAYVSAPSRPYPKLEPFTATDPDERLIAIASLFVSLQEARHKADYDMGARFDFAEAAQLVSRAVEAFADFTAIEDLPETKAFLADRWTRRG